MIETYEVCICDQCENTIPRTNVKREFNERTGVRKITTRCDICDSQRTHEHMLSGGVWVEKSGAIESNARRREIFQRQIDRLRGVRQLRKV